MLNVLNVRVTSRNNTLPGDSSSESINYLHNSPVMKQESETEVLINGIQSIQRASQNNLYDMENPQPSTSGYIKQVTVLIAYLIFQ